MPVRRPASKRKPPEEVREPEAPAYSVRKARAKLFQNGRSQAVRLPKEFRLPGTEVLVHREGRCVVLEPVEAVDKNGWPIGLPEELRRLREGLDLDEFQIPDDPVPEPIPPLDES